MWRMSRKLLTLVFFLQIQRPVVHNLSDNFRDSWVLAFLGKVANGLGTFGPMPDWVEATHNLFLIPREEVQDISELE